MRRHLIGILALALLLTAAVLWLQGTQDGLPYQVETHSLRAGAFLAVLWLAYSDLYRIPPWLWAIFLPLAVIVVWRPRWLIVALPIALLLGILHPRLWPKGPNRRAP